MPPKPKTPAPRQRYRVVHGLDYDGKRAEPGEVRDDIPTASVSWLLEGGHIEPVEDGDT